MPKLQNIHCPPARDQRNSSISHSLQLNKAIMTSQKGQKVHTDPKKMVEKVMVQFLGISWALPKHSDCG